MNRLCLAILLSLFSISKAQDDFLKMNDTLLVFFSENKEINTQYYDMLRLKFPDLHLVNIANTAEFYRYVPIPKFIIRKHSKYIANSSRPANFTPETRADLNNKLVRRRDTSQKDSLQRETFRYVYFDISEIPQVVTLFTPQSKEYSFNLVRYDGEHLEGMYLTKVCITNNTQSFIDPWKLDEVSEWVNPILVTMYLDQGIMENISSCKSIKNTCKVQADDYIYIGGMLNNYYLGIENAPKSKYNDPDTGTQLNYFKHKHIKMSTASFNSYAYQKLSKDQHFFFYYFDPEKCIYHIIDGRNLTLVISFAVNNKGSIDNIQKQENIKKLSNFINDCKD